MARLAGQSYRIEMTPSGQVTRVLDSKSARSAAGGNRVALGLLKVDAIKRRHSISFLPATSKNVVKIGDNWSNITSTDFGMMGKRAYERIYALIEVAKVDGRRIAVVEMNAIPTTESPGGETPSSTGNPFEKMGDNIDEYTGLLKLDLATGSVAEYFERLMSQWIIPNPSPSENSKDQPDIITMTGVKDQRLERIE